MPHLIIFPFKPTKKISDPKQYKRKPGTPYTQQKGTFFSEKKKARKLVGKTLKDRESTEDVNHPSKTHL